MQGQLVLDGAQQPDPGADLGGEFRIRHGPMITIKLNSRGRRAVRCVNDLGQFLGLLIMQRLLRSGSG
jgi:hypothetical protein